MSSGQSKYQGDELPLFALATRWKNYVGASLAPYLQNRVLEVGAGMGAFTNALLHERVKEWTCLEPDPELVGHLVNTLSRHPIRDRVITLPGVTSDLAPDPNYDTILYLDVLEHIQDDAGELRRSANLVRDGGALIVLAPAYNWLFSPFDEAIGHHRRYNAATLAKLTPETLTLDKVFYLDSVGLFASLGNKILLSQRIPSRGQILFWDRCLIPLSRIMDRVIRFRAGRSVVAIWRKSRLATSRNR
jgi:phospholipid N-methyltransferase